ncbi:MAG: rod shape-determining protein RodA [Candidatus Dadabacteria bacterium]|nr:rod shape-determining protein RodA [Candidatus Dadabacteria bacterium]
MFDRRLLRNFDWLFFFIVIVVCAVGLINLFSASYQTGLSVFKKQLLWFALGIAAALFISFFDFKTLERYTSHMYVASILLLVIALIFGKEVSGSKSWISLGKHITIQPSELAKISIVLAIAKFYQGDFEVRPYGILDLVKPLLLVSLPLILVMLQPDLGTTLMILLISGSLVIFMGVRIKSIALLVILIIGLSYPTWHYFLKGYQRERIETFLDPSRDPLGSGYNALQSQIGAGSGKFFGKGFKKGSQTQLRFIPEQHTDFIFSVLAEEWGFIGGFLTLLLYFLIILWIVDTASLAKDKFSMIVSLGIASIFFWHALINVGMVTGLLPVMGVPLPLLSYGGSSLLTAMLGVGIVLGIRMRRLPVTKEEIAL